MFKAGVRTRGVRNPGLETNALIVTESASNDMEL